MSITESDAKVHENSHVTMTLVDGTTVKGYVSGVGYQGLRIMVKGRETEWRFSAIESLKARK